MKREFLESLELDKEKVDAIMAEYGKSINSTKAELDQAKLELTSAKETITKLEASKTDSEAIAKELESYKSKTAELETKALEQTKNFKLKEALTNAKARNVDAVMPFLSGLEFDGQNFKDLDTKIKELKAGEGTSFLFEEEKATDPQPPKQIITGLNHSGAGEGKKLSGLEAAFQKLNPNIKL